MDSRSAELLYSVSQFQAASKRLKDVLEEEESDVKVDATIQRFEFTFELAWKTLKRALLYEGHICKSPRECLKIGFQLGFISREDVWLDMLDDRNAMSHVYSQEQARIIYEKIPEYCAIFQDLLIEFLNRYPIEG